MELKRIEELLYIPEEDKTTPVKQQEAEFIYHFLKQHQLTTTLEVGLGYGRSAIYIMSATGQPHIAIDPFQQTYQNGALANIEKAGLKNQFTHIAEFSHFALPSLCKQQKQFDFIFIDGDHKFDGILIDFYFSAMLLKDQGYILFHDTWMRATKLVTAFVENNRDDFRVVDTPLHNLHMIQKVKQQDARNGMYHREFYTFKGFLKYNVINYISSHPTTFLTRMIRTFKK